MNDLNIVVRDETGSLIYELHNISKIFMVPLSYLIDNEISLDGFQLDFFSCDDIFAVIETSDIVQVLPIFGLFSFEIFQ